MQKILILYKQYKNFFQNNLLGVKMLFEIQIKALANAVAFFDFKQLFSTSEVIPQQTQKRILYFLQKLSLCHFLPQHTWRN